MMGRPSLPWSCGEVLDMPDGERAEYIKRLSDMVERMNRK